ncbi:MAG TPA: hypothetical protein VL463_01995 [Kofleriaceae bacterium]|jgi:hypothetical protein|nr:hypothetical protein [Kofleriaceae bacterium]
MRWTAWVLVFTASAACGSPKPATDARPADAAAAPTIDAAPGPDASGAGRVTCASTTCPALPTPQQNVDSEDYCCSPMPTGSAATCVHGNLGACESGDPFYCDEAADCQTGLSCCENSGRKGLFACYDTCDGLQACSTTAECKNVGPCTMHHCGGSVRGFCGLLTPTEMQYLSCVD